jgi:hypothetical protein
MGNTHPIISLTKGPVLHRMEYWDFDWIVLTPNTSQDFPTLHLPSPYHPQPDERQVPKSAFLWNHVPPLLARPKLFRVLPFIRM